MAAQSAFARAEKLAEETVHTLLRERKTIGTMESCTGGLLASLLTDIPGASEVFPGGFVTYSNKGKLASGVDAAVLETHGVYSAACAEAMAAAVQKAAGTDYAVGVTGTLGRIDPANRDSVPGEVFFCILRAAADASPASEAEAVAGRLELDPTLPRPEAKLAVAEAVFTRLLSLL